jgi:flavin reductase (DIM6/NTAB) family NADH-FMN oxidoreductase RutF
MALRNPLNRPMRTRMSGGVARASGQPLPLCRLCYLQIIPMPTTSLSLDLFRRVMGSFPTGITVITAEREPGQVHGMTANSLTSVSLDPLLILVCVDQRARLLGHLKVQRCFGVNILKHSQQPIAEFFAKPEQDAAEEASLAIRFRWTASGIPLLEDALAHLSCNVVAQYMSGDHTIVVGEVESLELHEGEPLVHHRGHCRRLADL